MNSKAKNSDTIFLSKRALTEQIKAYALNELGIDFIGFAKAEADLQGKERLDQFIQAGYHGQMKYLENTELRSNPQMILPEANTVIVIAINYYREKSQTPLHQGRVARYAYGRDYHKVFKKILKNLANYINEITEKPHLPVYTRACVDSAPILERAFAQKAGIGFVGKNGLIITKDKGSFVLLGELLTSLDLEFSQSASGTCGTCTRCIEACPTDALLGEGKMDARKCISYLTIENKSTIPNELANKMENLIYGCDICQEVCPYNKQFAKPLTLKAFQEVKIAGDALDLKEILNIQNDEEYLEKFAGSPAMRAKRHGMIRNALVAAANGKQIDLIEQIKHLAQNDQNELVKAQAAATLINLNQQNQGYAKTTPSSP